ncbi:MAG: hypothetical protein QM768_01605 [Agriterribacter sp.]
MKKRLFLPTLICLTTNLFAQTDTTNTDAQGFLFPEKEHKTNRVFSKDEYLKKSRRQRTAAIILVSSGGAEFAAGGFIIIVHGISAGLSAATDIVRGALGDGGRPETKKHNNSFATALMITGAASMLGSIPLFSSSRDNKRKAVSLSFKTEFAPGLQNNVVINQPVPGISLSLKF